MSRLGPLFRKYTNDSKEITTIQHGVKVWPKVSYANLVGMGLVRALSTIAFALGARAASSGRAAGTESSKKTTVSNQISTSKGLRKKEYLQALWQVQSGIMNVLASR